MTKVGSSLVPTSRPKLAAAMSAVVDSKSDVDACSEAATSLGDEIVYGCVVIRGDEHHAVPDEHPRPDRDSFADEAVAADLAACADFCALLDFHKRADPALVADLASVKIHKLLEPHTAAQLHVRRDTLISRPLVVVHGVKL